MAFLSLKNDVIERLEMYLQKGISIKDEKKIVCLLSP
jgi:hypothetical protein